MREARHSVDLLLSRMSSVQGTHVEVIKRLTLALKG